MKESEIQRGKYIYTYIYIYVCLAQPAKLLLHDKLLALCAGELFNANYISLSLSLYIYIYVYMAPCIDDSLKVQAKSGGPSGRRVKFV